MPELKRAAIVWRDPTALLIAGIAGLGTAHILVRTATYGAAVTTDSIELLSTALNFLAGEGWRSFSGDPLVGWPPLFPLLLAVLGWVGIELLEAGRWINAAAFGLTILAAGRWLHTNLQSRLLALTATAIIAASLPLSDWAANYMTEPLFILLTLLALIQLSSFRERKKAWTPLLWAAVLTALAVLTRYPGVVLIGTGVLLLGRVARLRQPLAFGAIASVPLLAVLAFNWTTSKTLTGGRITTSGQSLAAGLSQIVAVFHEWIVPPNAPHGTAYLLWLAVAAVVFAGAAVGLHDRRPDPEAAPPSFGLGPAFPFGGFAALYLVFMVAVVPLAVDQGIDSRYLLPIYVPLLLTAAFLLDRFLSIEATGRMRAGRYGLASLVLLAALAHVGFSAHKNLWLTARAQAAGYPAQAYNAAQWRHSETVQYLRDHPIEGKVYSNNKALAWFADQTGAPGKHQPLPDEIQYIDNEAGAHIVCFWAFYNRGQYGYDIMDLYVLPGVETAAELADGAVFRVTAAAAAERFNADQQRARKERYVAQLLEQTGERVVRADWDVYRTGRQLIYRKNPCVPADVQAKFILQVTPADPAELPAHRKRYGFDSLGFYFNQRGFQFDDQCIAIAQLPAYPTGRIRVGQWIANGNRTLWEADF